MFTDGSGGGGPWAREHLLSGYRACWQTPLEDGDFDSALCNRGLSRWANFYVEGLARLLAPPAAIDGVYYDGISFGADTMRRVRRVLQRETNGAGLLDLHCGNNLPGTQYGAVSPALQFMHLFPYIDALWFGEGYDYDEPDDYWLIEISGLPFGLGGDMMREGNPWRGMLFGMTGRPRAAHPTALWSALDAFGIANATVHGFWNDAAQIARAECAGVLATVYARRGTALLALASWASETAHCAVTVDWIALGIQPARARAWAPRIDGFQPAIGSIEISAGGQLGVEVETGRGWLIRLDARARRHDRAGARQ